MIDFNRILFPVDFSEQCAAIAPAVKAMVQRFNAELTAVHVLDLPTAWYGTPEGAAWGVLINADRIREEGRIALDRFVNSQLAGMNVKQEILEGEAAHKIAECAREYNAELIMMPTRGYGPFRALLLGSVTAKVLHDAQCSVWTGTHAEELREHPPERWKKMLCALDADPKDLSTLRWAAEFATEQRAELRLVHAVRGAGGTITKEGDPSMYEFLFNIARDEIAKLQATAGTAFDTCLLAGNVGRVVRQAAIGHSADLIIVGRGVIHKTLGGLRSSTYSIIREAPCPAISI